MCRKISLLYLIVISYLRANIDLQLAISYTRALSIVNKLSNFTPIVLPLTNVFTFVRRECDFSSLEYVSKFFSDIQGYYIITIVNDNVV